jgi:hypothetical protein
MNAPREPNVRIRTTYRFDQPQNLGRQNTGPNLHRGILTLGPKWARQDVSDPGAPKHSGREAGELNSVK